MHRRQMSRSRSARLVTAFGLTAALVVGPVSVAQADGPGYGGDAGQLAVSWEPVSDALPAAATVLPPMATGGSARGVGALVRPVAAEPELQADALALVVRGLGFRGKSEIEVRVGSGRPLVARADSAGALAVAIDPEALGAAKPGVSVMAVGRNQAGTEVTLFGSIPPVADGSGPMSLVPWAVGAIALASLALWFRRRHAQHDA